ncbi:MAG: hypothetical protein R3B06_19665 [Kofleriaceae bacterium]
MVAAGAVSDDALTEFYRSRLMVPQVSPATLAKLPAAVVAVLPADMAVEYRVVPVSLDKDGNLTVAMSDPSDRHAVDEIGFFTSKYVVRAVAAQMQIAWCLAHYYDYVTELAERLMNPAPPTAPAPTPPPPAAVAAPQPTRARGDTAKVDAARHRVLVPATTPPPIAARPGPDSLDRAAPAAPRDGAPPEADARTIELVPDDPDGDSGPFALEAPLAPPGPIRPPVDPFAAPAFGASATVVVSADAARPQRARPAAPDPPELAARSGEVERTIRDHTVDTPGATIEINLGDEPALDAAIIELDRRRTPTPAPLSPPAPVTAPPPVVVVTSDAEVAAAPVEDDEDDPAIIHDTLTDTESAPILLEHLRRGEAPPDHAPAIPEETDDEPSGPVLLLERKKGRAPRRDKHTVLGIGMLGPIPRSTEPPPLGPRSPTLPPPIGDDAVPEAVTDEEAATRRVEFTPPTPSVDAGWDADTVETFGPPGTTIPPPYLGAVEGIADPPSGQIPLATGDPGSAPLTITAQPARRPQSLAPPPDPEVLARQLEEASLALVDLLRGLDGATTRDHVVAMLIDFVAATHHRVAFLAAKNRELTAFMQIPEPPPGAGQASLDLSAPSTFQDVIGTRLPYRGPFSDAASRELVRAMFGSATDDMLAVPVAVRDRVVGIVYADGRYRHSYDEHVTVGGRAAGLALERILKGKRG